MHVSRILRVLCLVALPLTTRAAEPEVKTDTPESRAESLQICLAAAADFSAVYPTDTVPPARELVAVFRLPETHPHRAVQFRWVAVDVGEAAPANFEIATGELALRAQHRGALRLTGLQQPVPVGSYRLEVQTDGKPWKTVDFRVAEVEPLEERPEWFPLPQGAFWNYQLSVEAGRGVKLTVDGEEVKGGRMDAPVTMAVVGKDMETAHLELKRSGKVFAEEWWRTEGAKLVATQRHTEGELTRLEPPQTLVDFRADSGATWTYSFADLGIQQRWQQWGPVPVETPAGRKAGFVVLVRQNEGVTQVTVERHFVPGLGMVRERAISVLGEALLKRQDMVFREDFSN